MGSQLFGGNPYNSMAGLAGQHGGPGNAQMFNQMTATPQYQQGLNQQGMAMQGLTGLMQALAYYHQRKQDQMLMHPQGASPVTAGTSASLDANQRPPMTPMGQNMMGSPFGWSLDQMNRMNQMGQGFMPYNPMQLPGQSMPFNPYQGLG